MGYMLKVMVMQLLVVVMELVPFQALALVSVWRLELEYLDNLEHDNKDHFGLLP
jgi:hypothetical protein